MARSSSTVPSSAAMAVRAAPSSLIWTKPKPLL
jgi:hypothetical protein